MRVIITCTRIIRGAYISVVLGLCLIGGCAKPSPPELNHAASVIHFLMRPANLSHSVFSAAYAKPNPSDFVSYIFSPMGVAEWPDSNEPELMRSIHAPIPPPDVHFAANKVNWSHHKQIVVSYDDFRNLVIVTAYLEPHLPPVFVKEWKFTSVNPAPGVQEIYRANVELGYSIKSF